MKQKIEKHLIFRSRTSLRWYREVKFQIVVISSDIKCRYNHDPKKFETSMLTLIAQVYIYIQSKICLL